MIISFYGSVQKNFGAYLAIASNVPNAVFVILNAAFGQRFPFVRRVVASSSVVIVFFVAVTILGWDQYNSLRLYSNSSNYIFKITVRG